MSDPPATPTDFVDLSALSAESSSRISAHFRSVGVIASLWTGFELMLDISSIEIGRIPDEAGLCLTSQIAGPARKLDAYVALARLRGADAFARELNEFAKDTQGIGERRNRVIHDPWLFFTENGPAIRLETTARRSLRHKFVEMTLAEMTKLIRDINAHVTRFFQLHQRILAAVSDT
jgi:hypothetical protein